MGDTLTEGQKLVKGESLTSSNGAYTLTLQDDGNLVLASRGHAIWSSGTNGRRRRPRRGPERRQLRPVHRRQAGVAHRHQGQEERATRSAGRPQSGAVLRRRAGVVDQDRDRRAAAARARSSRTGSRRSPRPRTRRHAHEPEPEPAARTYTVESGDTLWAISERFYGDGSKYQIIADASGISNPDLIQPGQVLTIP